jgi:ribonucleoside-triphosphate reductase
LDIDLDGEDVVLKPHYDSIVRVRRITGYLSTLPRFNDAKRSEAKERVAHL